MLLPMKRFELKSNSRLRLHTQRSRPAVWFRLLMMLAVAASGFALMTAGGRGAATGVISGNVYQDYNQNGTKDTALSIPNNGTGNVQVAVDHGIAGVTVTAFNSAGANSGSAVTDGAGNYSINTAGSTGPYRVEFTNLPAGYYSTLFGPNSGTTVQKVPEGGASGISLGLVFPADYSQNNPTLAVPRYADGPATGTEPTIVSFPYSAGSASVNNNTPTSDWDLPGITTVAVANQVGATWGLAWSRFERRLYAGAFMKRWSGFAATGTGAIYRIDPVTQTVTTYADLNALFGAGTAGVNPHNFADPFDGGNNTWDKVGKVGLGGVAIADDASKLYVMNLADRQLYELPIGAVPSVANIRRTPVPLNPPGCPSTDDVRPFAVNYYRGTVYVGVTCTAESTTAGGTVTGNQALMAAHVYAVNPGTLAFGASPVHTLPLNYQRLCGDSKQFPVCNSALWLPWTPIYKNISEIPPSQFIQRAVYPQPWLTAIDFDKGNLLMGIRDRVGDQTGLRSLDNPARPAQFYFGVGTGDQIRACGSPNSWTTESNGRCAGIGSAPQNTGEGPGNGEYYFRDNSPIFNDETVMGNQVQVPGFPDSVTGVIHPIPTIPVSNDDTAFDGGVRWFVNGTGAFSKNFRVYNDDANLAIFFGKANGLGDLTALVNNPVSEIGNYVWYDVNKNGIQDPNETPFSGVNVQLYQGVALLGSTVTNGVGQYYFNSSNVAGGIQPGIAYEVRISLADAALGGKLLTIPNQGSDIHDSDGTSALGNAVISASVPVLGASDHTFDFGFTDPVFDADLSIRKKVSPNCVEPGSRITFTVTVTNNGPAVATNVTVVDDLPFGLIFDSATPSQGSCNALDPMTCNLGTLGVGVSATITIRETVPANPSVSNFTNKATVTADQPDPNPSNNSAQASAILLVPGNPNIPVGPGELYPPSAINDQKAGSILFYNYYTSNGSVPNLQNSRVSITNTNPGQFVFAHLFFVDGTSCSMSDKFVCLTANQTVSFLLSDLDPGVSGYLVAIAVDEVLGCPIEFNHLIGDAFIKTMDGHQANLAAESIAWIPGRESALCDGSSATRILIFDGSPGNYDRVPRTLASSSLSDFASGNRTLLIINRFGGDFLVGGDRIPPIFGILYDQEEVSASFNIPRASCQIARVLSDSFPMTVPRYSVHIGPGETGWLKFFAADDVGLMGAIINYNPNVATSQNAFNQGRNLHKLTFATVESIRIPIIPPH